MGGGEVHNQNCTVIRKGYYMPDIQMYIICGISWYSNL